jgi:hypothetical protein
MAKEQLVHAYSDGTIFSFERAHKHSGSAFGGPMGVSLSGIEHGPKPLHTIARLAATDLRITQLPPTRRDNLFDIPLIYGMCYDGCDIEYHVDTIVRHVELRKMSPTQSSDDWPYPNFPLLLPFVPLQVGETRRCSYAEFAEAFPNMPEQQPTELVVAVPPPATLGVSLWGWEADDDVTILFECDLADQIVYASNRCS